MLALTYIGSEAWCPACRVFSPVVRSLASELALPVRWLDADEDLKAVASLSVCALPTLIVTREGVEEMRIEGAYSRKVVLSRLEALNA